MTEEFANAIAAKVGELEKKTSVEFVPVHAAAASQYRVYRLLVFWMLFAAGQLAIRANEAHAGAEWSSVHAGLRALLFALAGSLLLRWRWLWRHMLPSALKRHAVEAAAERHFLHEEVFATRARTGVLIFVSELERAVFILADKGLRSKVGDAEWSQLSLTLAHDFNRGGSGEVFLHALDALATRLAPDFPPGADNPNELPDNVRER